MDIRRALRFSLLVLLFGVAGGRGAHAQVVVVVHPDNPLSVIGKEQIGNIFLGRTHSFPDGKPAMAVELSDTHPAFSAFHAAYTNMTPTRLKAHWAKLVFSLRAMPPREMTTPAEVRKFVAANPGAIAYLDQADADASVRVLR